MMPMPPTGPMMPAGGGMPNIDAYPDPALDAELAETAEDEAASEQVDHTENLAEGTILPDDFKRRIGTRVVDMVRRDRDSRSEWDEQQSKGYELLGFDRSEDERTDPFPGASSVNHPMLAEACADFAARTMKEMFPPNGPVRTEIIGRETPSKMEMAARVAEHMNYQLTIEIPEYAEEVDTMLMQLPICGSAFKKLYWDPTLNRPAAEYIKAEDFVVPYGAKSLQQAPRYTHVLHVSESDLRRNQVYGLWLDIPLSTPVGGEEESRIKEVNDQIQGEQPSEDPADALYEIFEMHIDLDDADLLELEPDAPAGLPLPYIVTVHKDSGRLLALRRNWKFDDQRYSKRCWFVHYKFMPWRGFYGIGLFHLIGGMSRAATGTLRAMLDHAMIRSVPGGLRKKVARSTGQTITIAACTWNEVETTPGQSLSDCFMPFPVPDSDPVMFTLLDFLTKSGKEFANVATQAIQDANNTGPVGTTLALIEQGSAVYSAIHARLHRAETEELKLLGELNRENLDEEVGFSTAKADAVIRAMDYGEHVAIVPTSNPQVFSQVQRAEQSRAMIALGQQAKADGQNVNMAPLYQRAWQTLNLPMMEEVFQPVPQPRPLDPVSEFAALAAPTGIPVQAFPGQDHQAHVMYLMAKAQDPQTMPIMQMIGPKLQALVASHIVVQAQEEAALAVQQAAQMIGRMPPPQMVEQIVAQAAMKAGMQRAQQAQMQAEQMAQQGGGEDGLAAAAMADVKRKAQADQIKAGIDQAKIQAKAEDDKRNADIRVAEIDLERQKDQVQQAADTSVEVAKIEAENQRERERLNTDLTIEQMRINAEDQRAADKLAADVALQREENADDRLAAQQGFKPSVST